MMNLDEQIAFCKEKSKNIKLKTEPQTFIDIAESLENLKKYENLDFLKSEQIRGKAIDDFKDRLSEKIKLEIDDYVKEFELIYEISERMKKGE